MLCQVLSMTRSVAVNFLMAVLASILPAQQTSTSGPYRVVKTATVGGSGNFDYVYADVGERRLYIPRYGPPNPRITVFNLDTLAPVGEIPNASARGVAIDPKSNHGFASSKPVVMWDTKTLATIKTIDVQGNPDGILFDPFNERVWVFSHAAPNATIINATDGSVVGTLDLGGQPEQAATDGKGHIWVDLEDKSQIAAVDTKTLTVTAHYDLGGKGGEPAGMAFDAKNRILFSSCANPAALVVVHADDGKIIASLPIGNGTDGAIFNPATMEIFSSQRDGTLTVIKENSPTSFAVAQTVTTMPSAKTMTLDTKTNRILLIGAEFGTPPAPAPGGRPGRGPMVPDSFSIIVVSK
jgi:DNA-binding beta-propeller fold protein YncE